MGVTNVPGWAVRVATMTTLLLALWVLLALTLASTTPWFHLRYQPPPPMPAVAKASDDPNPLDALFGWDEILVSGSKEGLVLQESYSRWFLVDPSDAVDLGAVHGVATTTLLWILMSCACWVAFVVVTAAGAASWWNERARQLFQQIYLARFGLLCGACGGVWLCAAWITYCFVPVAFSSDLSPDSCDELGVCSGFAGSKEGVTWGPYTGWSFALAGSVCSACTLAAFALAFATDILHPWLGRFVVVSPPAAFTRGGGGGYDSYNGVADREIVSNPSAGGYGAVDGLISRPFPIEDGRNPYDDGPDDDSP
jgi:hypothetical protein